ncbi:MAG: DUF1501 domain-containing protein [Bacteroidota bacterium]
MRNSAFKDRTGSRLQDGKAHSDDHRNWSRRDFLGALGASAGGTMMLGGAAIRPLGGTMYSELLQSSTDRVLVLIQLNGGNDGLNTLIPVEDDTYYQLRPNVSVAKSEALLINNEMGFHPSFEKILPLYNEGQMAILQNVGYPEQDFSHFRSTDIWMSGSEPATYWNTGWIGRSMQLESGEDVKTLEYPLAVQLGSESPLLIKGEDRSMGMSVNNPDTFERLAATGKVFDEDNVQATRAGEEISFVRSVANDAFRYAGAIQEAANAGRNGVNYPNNNYLAHNLSIVARLIKGNLGSRIYHVCLGGFDTHADQVGQHAMLLRYLSEAVAAFQADLADGGWQDRVLTMTFSEFGRRVDENGSRGTDHGSAAPLFLFGPTVAGGLYGSRFNLTDLDMYGNLRSEFNFRNVYATVLQDWFGFSPSASQQVMGEAYSSLGFVARPIATTNERPQPETGFALHTNYPNPFIGQTNLSFTLPASVSVRLRVFDAQGRHVHTVVDGVLGAGRHEIPFRANGLPSGRYFYRLESPNAGTKVGTMTLLR